MLVKIEEPNYYIEKSKKPDKKYSIYKKIKNKFKYLLSFGGDPKIYQHYKDTSPLKIYTHLNHNDKDRRRKYYMRHSRTMNKNSSRYWSNKYLWG